MLLAARDGAAAGWARRRRATLAALGRHELLVTQVVAGEALLAGAVAATRGMPRRAGGRWRDEPGGGLRLARLRRRLRTTRADARRGLVIVGGPCGGPRPTARFPKRWHSCSSASPCDVALLAGRRRSALRATASPCLFGGGEHDWAAAELGAWLAAGAGARLHLIGARRRAHDDGADASRLLASASLAIQQVVGIDVEPGLADPGPDGLVAATSSAGIAVVGLSPRWRQEGLGVSRSAVLAAVSPTLVVHRGARPGGLAPHEGLTRYTWTIAAAADQRCTQSAPRSTTLRAPCDSLQPTRAEKNSGLTPLP